MVRSLDEFWEYVERTNEGPLLCKHCGLRLAGNTSINRIKKHLSGIRGQGVNVCPNVPDDVKQKAYDAVMKLNDLAVRGPDKKQKKGSSDGERANGASTSMGGQNNQVGYGGEDEDTSQPAVTQTIDQQVGEWTPFSIPGFIDAQGAAGEISQTENESIEPMITLTPKEQARLTDYTLSSPAQDTTFMTELPGLDTNFTDQQLQAIVENLSQLGPEFSEDDGVRKEHRHDAREARENMQLKMLTQGQPIEITSHPDADAVNIRKEKGQPVSDVDGGSTYEQQGTPLKVGKAAKGKSLAHLITSKLIRTSKLIKRKSSKLINIRDGGFTSGTGNVEGESMRHAKGVSFLTRELEGKAFEEAKYEVWSWLMSGISTIGIYGMGGVGKTTLMTHINNQLLKIPNNFQRVYWITIGQEFSIYRMQDLIAETIGLNLLIGDERKRASVLKDALIEKRTVIIIDDLWNHFTTEDVGIPDSGDGCRLIVTTRSLDICNRLDCEKKMKLEPLNREEAWTLFKKILGHELPSVVEQLAESVALECAGLPLGIITMAGSMKGVHDNVHEWRYALEKLKESEVRPGDDMEDKVFRILRFSYSRLKDPKLQECFLYCALFPEDSVMRRDELIESFIDEGITVGKSRLAEVDEGHVMLNKLESSCLLQPAGYIHDCVKMHDLIRDLALQELRKRYQVIVHARTRRGFPYEEEWTENLEKVSIMMCEGLILPTLSPDCPKLSTLLLSGNYGLKLIGDPFFKQLKGLKVLDVSYTGVKTLPSSISDLVSLKALVAKKCQLLEHVPSLAKLRGLEKLDLRDNILKEVPEGMEQLSKLEYLNLKGTEQAEFPVGILPNLSNLQVLVVSPSIRAGEVVCLRKLEALECKIYYDVSEVSELNTRVVWRAPRECRIVLGPKKIALLTAITPWDPEFDREHLEGEEVDQQQVFWLGDGICKQVCKMLLRGISMLHLWCSKVVHGSPDYAWHLVENFERLEIIDLRGLSSLNGTFSNLKGLCISDCGGMKKLFDHSTVLSLRNLEEFQVLRCWEMEEIVGTGECSSSRDSSIAASTQLSLPKLRELTLSGLPILKRICGEKMSCGSLQTVKFCWCWELKNVSLSLPELPSLQTVLVYPEELVLDTLFGSLGHVTPVYRMRSRWNKATVSFNKDTNDNVNKAVPKRILKELSSANKESEGGSSSYQDMITE